MTQDSLAPPANENEVLNWDRIASDAAISSGLANLPIIEARLYAVTSLAMHDALNAIDRRSRPYALRLRALPDASPEAAIATAAHEILVDQFGRMVGLLGLSSQQALLDEAYTQALSRIPDDSRKSEGVFIGAAAAAAMLAVRANDGWETQTFQDSNYVEGTKPGEYRFTEGTPFAFLPNWGDLPPFALRDGSQFRPPPPYNTRGRRYARDVNEIKALGGNGTTTPSIRTPYETQTALFWLESSPTQWNRIGRSLASDACLDLWRTSRLFALLNVSLADGYIGSLNAKYDYRFWRPETAIRIADSDGNADTIGDPTWTPLVQTPPIPDYDSAHAVEGAAAAQIFARFFGRDRITFSACSLTLTAGQNCGEADVVYRTYSRFSEAAKENGLSRILVGFHFRHAVDEGLEHGAKIGDWTIDHVLKLNRRSSSGGYENDDDVEVADRY